MEAAAPWLAIPCPNCHAVLQPPAVASRHAKLRCPVCHHELESAELLLAGRRHWMVIEDPGGEDAFEAWRLESAARQVLAAGGQPVGPSPESVPADDDGHGYRLAAESPTPSRVASGAKNQVGKKQVDWSKFKPITHEEFESRMRQASSPWSAVIQAVLGGLLAIPLSLGMIWFLLGKDIGGLAPRVARFAPWMVPPHLRGDPQEDPREGLPLEKWGADQTIPAAPRRGRLPQIDLEVDGPGDAPLVVGQPAASLPPPPGVTLADPGGSKPAGSADAALVQQTPDDEEPDAIPPAATSPPVPAGSAAGAGAGAGAGRDVPAVAKPQLPPPVEAPSGLKPVGGGQTPSQAAAGQSGAGQSGGGGSASSTATPQLPPELLPTEPNPLRPGQGRK
jgi:hypothetical protein